MWVERQLGPRPVEAEGVPYAVAMAPLLAAAAAAAVGVSAVIGWLGDLPDLLSWGAAPTMKLNTALALIVAAGAMALLHRPSRVTRRVAHVACSLVACVAMLTLLEWVLGRSLGIDQLLVHDPATSGAPGRPSPHSAIALGLFALALMTLDPRSTGARRTHQLLGGAFLAAVLLSALGWLYGASELTGHSRITGLSLPALAGLATLLVGSLFLRPAAPPFALVRGSSPAATMTRRVIPAVLIGPPLLGGLRLLGAEAGWYSVRFGLALFATSMVVTFLGVVLATARSLARGDQERRRAELALAEAEAEQAALRRVATAVAEGAGSTAVFDLIAEEVARLLGLDVGVVVRFENAREAAVMGKWFADPATTVAPIVKLDGDNATSLVARTGRAARIDFDERTTTIVVGTRAGVAAPISVAGKLWGTVGAAAMVDEPLPADAEERTVRFADLAATAIANAGRRRGVRLAAARDRRCGRPLGRRACTPGDRARTVRARRHSDHIRRRVFPQGERRRRDIAAARRRRVVPGQGQWTKRGASLYRRRRARPGRSEG